MKHKFTNQKNKNFAHVVQMCEDSTVQETSTKAQKLGQLMISQ